VSLFEKIITFVIKNKRVIKTEQVPMDEIDEIICLSNTAIGDTLFNTPIFRALKSYFPDKKLTVVLNPNNASLFETNPYIGEILLYDGKSKNFLSFLYRLKKKQPKLILLLHSNEPQATPLSVLAGAQYILKVPNDKTKYNIWHTNPPTKFSGEYTVLDKLKQLKYLGIPDKRIRDCRMELFLKEEWKEEVHKALPVKEGERLIGFQIGASHLSRMWFNDRWIELGKKLLESKENIRIILTGAPSEQKITEEVASALNDDRVINCAGRFSLGGAAALIGKLDVLITPDTGPLHIAAALKTPTIALYAVMDHWITNPAFDKEIHLYIQKPKTCTPCVSRQCKFQECMLQISVEEVYEMFRQIIK